MKVEDFVAITKDLCGFPSFFNAPFFRRILASVHNTAGAKSPSAAAPQENATDDDAPRITKDVFQAYWTKELAPYDSVERFFRVVRTLLRLLFTGDAELWRCESYADVLFSLVFLQVKQPQSDYIERDDFAPFLHGIYCVLSQRHLLLSVPPTHWLLVIADTVELLKYHPGLEFLGNTPEFQEKYGACG